MAQQFRARIAFLEVQFLAPILGNLQLPRPSALGRSDAFFTCTNTPSTQIHTHIHMMKYKSLKIVERFAGPKKKNWLSRASWDSSISLTNLAFVSVSQHSDSTCASKRKASQSIWLFWLYLVHNEMGADVIIFGWTSLRMIRFCIANKQ